MNQNFLLLNNGEEAGNTFVPVLNSVPNFLVGIDLDTDTGDQYSMSTNSVFSVQISTQIIAHENRYSVPTIWFVP